MISIFEGRTADDIWQQALHHLYTGSDVQIHTGRGGNTREILHAMFVLEDPRQRWVLIPFSLA